MDAHDLPRRGRPKGTGTGVGHSVSTRLRPEVKARLDALQCAKGYTIAEVLAAGLAALEAKHGVKA